jgi:hypothetical protein
MLEVRVKRCTGRPTCGSDQEIDAYLKEFLFGIYTTQTVIDYDSLEQPLQAIDIWPLYQEIGLKRELNG